MVEQSVLVRHFTAGALKDIERNYGVVFDPLEASLAKLVAAKRPFGYIINRDNPDFMNLVSRSTQIAIFPQPKNLYVPESNNLSLDQQRKLLKVDEAEVVKKKMGIGGLKFIMGEIATHTGFVFAYFDRSGGIRLHGVSYDYRYARTETPTVGSSVAYVGGFDEVSGLGVYDWSAGNGDPNVWVVRLGVPAQEQVIGLLGNFDILNPSGLFNNLNQSLQSYLGYLSHANSYQVEQQLKNSFGF